TQLLLAKLGVVGILSEEIIVGGCREVGNNHAALHPLLEIYVLIEADVGPKIDHLNHGVLRPDAVDTAETLDDPHRIPMNVIVDHEVAVLQVLTLRDAVSTDQ